MKVTISDSGTINSLNKIQEKYIDNIKDKIAKACLLVEADAKRNVAYSTNGDGMLARSIISDVSDRAGEVGTNLQYAVYVHYGTGKWAVNGDGHQGYWVYVKGQESDSTGPSKSYTLEEAKKIVAMMRSQGLEAYYTDGQRPNPFLEKALDDNKQNIIDLIKS